MTSKFKILLTIIVIAAIAVIVGLMKAGPRDAEDRDDTQMEQPENGAPATDAKLPEATGSVDDLFDAIDQSAAQEDQYAASEADQLPADDTAGFDQSVNENGI